MTNLNPDNNRRVLIVDDNRSIHDDFRKILSPAFATAVAVDATERAVFGGSADTIQQIQFEVASAYQGQEGLRLAQQAVLAGLPYAMAFVDVRMPPGWDGIETTRRLWELDPGVQVVLCTAYSDYSWEDMAAVLGHSDRLLVLKKPFEALEVLQLASSLTEKWCLHQQARLTLNQLEILVRERTMVLDATNQRLEREIAERKEREAQIRKLSRAVEQSPASIVITDPQGLIEYVNPKFCALTGYSFDEARGQNPRLLKSGEMSLEHYRQLWGDICAGCVWRGEFHNKKKNGELYWEFASISAVKDESGRITHFVAVKEDITERKQSEAEQDRMIKSLEEALAKVRTLSGLIPICAGCKRIRDDKGYWSQVEIYVAAHSEARFSHGLCPECMHKYYPDVDLLKSP